MQIANRRRTLGVTVGILAAVLAVSLFVFGARREGGIAKSFRSRVIVPEALLLEDFQRPLDRELIGTLTKAEKNLVAQLIDAKVLRPYFDDVVTINMAVQGVEITEDQFSGRPELFAAVRDCARALHLQKVPRVFVLDKPGLSAYTVNLVDPIIVLHASILRRYHDPAEIRFIIGHEMGHIRAGHVRWLTVVRGIMATAQGTPLLPDHFVPALLLPVLKWGREAEMSADNAGLICAQDLPAAERALVRLTLGLEDRYVGKINVDAYLRQRDTQKWSEFSEVVQYLRQFQQEHPFLPDRIRQLREYHGSRNYRHLWE